MRALYQKFSHILEEISLSEYSLKPPLPLIEIPKEKKHGDFSSMVALKIASQTKENPLTIANRIMTLLARRIGKDVEHIEVLKPGFVNVFISKDGLIDSVNRIVTEGADFFREERKRKICIEFVSANPTGPLSIAHGRQAVVGDTVARVLEFFANTVTREYYINDEGRQIDLLATSVAQRIKEIKGEKFSLPEDGYKGEYIKDVARSALSVAPAALRAFVIEKLLSVIREDLEKLDIHFNSFFSQKDLIEGGAVTETIEFLKKKGFVAEKDGALWFLATKFGDDKDRVLKKSDGELTYFASDIAYHKDKIERNPDALLNLWGPDHHGYIKRVRSAIRALGHDEECLTVLIIQLVTLKTKQRMSKRKGTMILLSDLISEVGADAARFYYLLRRNSSPLEFDIDLAKSASFDNPLYYVQYAHARISSIFAKAGGYTPDTAVTGALAHTHELTLIRDILQFNYCLDKVYYSFEPVFLVEYLKNLAASFHKFYENVKVLSDQPDERQARLTLLRALQIVIDAGLRLLGITPLAKM